MVLGGGVAQAAPILAASVVGTATVHGLAFANASVRAHNTRQLLNGTHSSSASVRM